MNPARRPGAQHVPHSNSGRLIGSTLPIRTFTVERTAVVAIEHNGTIRGNPDAHQPLPVIELLLVGTDAEESSRGVSHARRRPLHRGRR